VSRASFWMWLIAAVSFWRLCCCRCCTVEQQTSIVLFNLHASSNNVSPYVFMICNQLPQKCTLDVVKLFSSWIRNPSRSYSFCCCSCSSCLGDNLQKCSRLRRYKSDRGEMIVLMEEADLGERDWSDDIREWIIIVVVVVNRRGAAACSWARILELREVCSVQSVRGLSMDGVLQTLIFKVGCNCPIFSAR